MLKPYHLVILCLALALIGCTAKNPPNPRPNAQLKHGETVVAYMHNHHPSGQPTVVVFYHHNKVVSRPYRIIGKSTVSRYNFIGMQRETKTVDNIMRNLAVSIGGDAVINITESKHTVEGTVISFEKMIL